MSYDFINVASMVRKILASGQIAAASTDTTIYTVPASSDVKIASASLTNVTAAPVTVTVSVVPSGGAIDGTHKILSSYSLAANDTITHKDVLSALDGVYLDAGAFVSVNVSAATAVDFLVTGGVNA